MTAASESPMADTAPPSKAGKLSERERNRENQRRLRERRKGYTQELEGRLQALEKKGVQATEVVQQAARTVVDENRALRQLLANKGVSHQEVDEYVRAAARGGVEQGLERRIAAAPGYEAVQHGAPAAPVMYAANRAQAGADYDTQTSARYSDSPHDSATGKQPATYDDRNIQPDLDAHTYVPPASVEQAMSSSVGCSGGGCGTFSSAAADSSQRNHDEMDCEEAARIITTLRGEEDPEAVWPQLGCSSAKRTTVKNSVLMSLAG